jgi:hypothetical protein
MADLKISALTASSTPLAGTEVLPIVQSGSTVKVSVANLTAGRDVAMLTANVGDASGQNSVFDAVVGSAAATTGDNTGVVVVSNATGKGWIGFNNGNSAGIPGQVTYNHNTNVMDFYSSGTYTLSNGNVTVSTGNVIIGTSGKGIDFSATAGSGTSELLADYEEGTWTPTVAGLTVVGTATYTGRYTKIGRLVTFDLQIESTTSTTATYPATTFTLPFNQAGAPRSVAVVSSGGVAQILTTFLYPPNWTAEPIVWISGSYSV